MEKLAAIYQFEDYEAYNKKKHKNQAVPILSIYLVSPMFSSP